MSDDTALTPEEIRALRELLDRTAIQECLNLYFHALDSRDFALLDRVFAPEIDLADGAPPVAHAELVTLLRGVEQFRVSHHGTRNALITVDGDTAHSNTYALDTLLVDGGESAMPPAGEWPNHDLNVGPVLRFHGLRYVDGLERRPEGWRIVRRRGPIALWQYHLAGVEVNPDVDAFRSATEFP